MIKIYENHAMINKNLKVAIYPDSDNEQGCEFKTKITFYK